MLGRLGPRVRGRDGGEALVLAVDEDLSRLRGLGAVSRGELGGSRPAVAAHAPHPGGGESQE